jgi:hypothetical protein
MKFADPSKLNRNPGGWGTRLFVVLPAVPNTNGGLIESLFLLRKPHIVTEIPVRNTPRAMRSLLPRTFE